MTRILASTALAMVLSGIGSAQPLAIQKEMLVGTWKLVSASNVTDKGIVKKEAYGRNPIGFLTYTADGRMMAIITDGSANRYRSTGEWLLPRKKPRHFRHRSSYAGTFTLTGNKVTHHVEASSDPNRVNTDLVRIIVKLEDDRVTLRTTAPFVWDGGAQIAYQELVWDRMK